MQREDRCLEDSEPAGESAVARKLLFATLTLILLSGTLGAYLWGRHEGDMQDVRLQDVRASIERLEREVRVRAGTGEVEVNGRGWPTVIDPQWFGDDPPLNDLVPADRPWLEVASIEDEELSHPGVRQSVTRSLASFWYNPATGRVRARIGPMVSDRKALVRYNAANGSAVTTLFDTNLRESAIEDNPRYEQLLSNEDRPGPMIVVRRRPAPSPHQIAPNGSPTNKSGAVSSASDAASDDQ